MHTEKHQGLSSAYKLVKRTLRNPRTCVLVTFFLGTTVAFLLTAIKGVPVPFAQDEFGYLLGADTFASGRLTNPTHPMWQHFETYHIIHQPSYISKYQPAQSLALATGQLLGHPIVGAWLATGFSMGALVWMLTGWLPRKYNWLMMAFVIVHPNLHLAWGQSYWGGTLAMVKHSLIAAAGTVLLANSRPFEGAVLTATVGLALLAKLVQNSDWHIRPFLFRVILPGFIVLGLGATWVMTYNQAVTGSPFEMPYRIHEAKYGWTPLFLWQTAGEKPTYRHRDMEAGYVWDKENAEKHYQTLFGVLIIKSFGCVRVMNFFCGGTIIFVLAALLWVLKKKRYQVAFLMLIPAFLAGMVTPWEYAHYCAPAAPLVILLLLASWIELWRRARLMPFLRIGMVIIVLVFQASWIVSIVKEENTSAQRSWAQHRAGVARKLVEMPGPDLVFVRYSKSHSPSQEWVYNDADIDGSEVVWAREISEEANEELMQYFRDRQVWILDADAKPAAIEPYREQVKAAPARG